MGSLADFEYRAYFGRLPDEAEALGFESLAATDIAGARWTLFGSDEGRAYAAARSRDWRSLVPPHAQPSEFGISNTGHGQFEVMARLGEAFEPVHSMLSIFELTALYQIARNIWRGTGTVVDLGPYYGLTSFALSYGMMHNLVVREEDKRQQLHVYDLFMSYAEPGTSIFPDFARINRRWADYQRVYPGNLLDLNWNGDPIEVLMIDLAKSFDLQDHVVRQFFPCLVPGATVIQQDYVYFDQYWIHVLMEIFRDHFEFKEAMYGCSAIYVLTSPLPDLSAWSLKDGYSTDDIIAIHRTHVEKASDNIQGVLWCAHAKMLIDFGRFEQARDVLGYVRNVRDPDQTLDFSGILPGNLAIVTQILEAAT